MLQGGRLKVLGAVVVGMVACLALSIPSAALAAPANDNFKNAITLSGTSASAEADNVGATKQVGEPDHRGDPGGASVWFSWTAPRSGGVFIQDVGGSYDESLVAAYTGDSVDHLTPVAPLPGPGENEVDFDLTFMASVGVTYRIAVDGKLDPETTTPSMGEKGLSLAMVPFNDNFENAEYLDAGPLVLYVGNRTIGATRQPGEPDHAGKPGGASVWFSWTATESGSVRLNACDANFPVLIAVYTGSTLTSLSPVESTEAPLPEVCREEPPRASAGFNVDPGTTYRIAVDGYGGASGVFDLDFEFSHDRYSFPHPVPIEPDRTAQETKLRDRPLTFCPHGHKSCIPIWQMTTQDVEKVVKRAEKTLKVSCRRQESDRPQLHRWRCEVVRHGVEGVLFVRVNRSNTVFRGSGRGVKAFSITG